MPNALSVYLGSSAARRIATEGWHPDLFDLQIGASGGAKWLILGHLDRVLFGDFLQTGQRELSLLGSSIGSWRHACLVQPDPVNAIDRLQAAYFEQQYSSIRPPAEEVSTASMAMLDKILGAEGVSHIVNHPRLRTHIVTARGRGPAGVAGGALLATGMGSAALGNSVNRKLLPLHFQRVVFHSSHTPRPGLPFADFATRYTKLDEANTARALHASGSIPFVLRGERDIPGAPRGQYWDGGIIDYHFDLSQYRHDGLILYPHFGHNIVPGWFDKFLSWRKTPLHRIDNLVLMCPSKAFIASLPYGKIPDRSDFKNLGVEERLRYWETCIEHSRALAEDFAALVGGSDPLAGTTLIAA